MVGGYVLKERGREMEELVFAPKRDWLIWENGMFEMSSIVAVYYYKPSKECPEPFIDVCSSADIGSQSIWYKEGEGEMATHHFAVIKQWLLSEGGTLRLTPPA